MEIQRILAADTKTATDKAIAQFGPDVLIISNNRVNGQTELLVAADITLEDERAAEPLAASKPTARGAQLHRADSIQAQTAQGMNSFEAAFEETMLQRQKDRLAGRKPTQTMATIAADLNDAPRKSAAAPAQQPVTPAEAPAPAAQVRREPEVDVAALQAQRDAARSREIVDLVRDEIAALRREFSLSQRLNPWQDTLPIAPAVKPLIAALSEAGIPTGLRGLLIDRIREAQDVEDAIRSLSAHLTDAMPTTGAPMPDRGVHILAGQTGVGKSLMVARLAQSGALTHGAHRVAIISFADTRPGAWSQTQMLAAQTGVDCYRAADTSALALLADELSQRALVVVDTAGVQFERAVAQAKQVLPQASVHAVLAADVSSVGIKRIRAAANWDSLMVSKLDEATQPWPLIQALCDSPLPISVMSPSERLSDNPFPYAAPRIIAQALTHLPLLSGGKEATNSGRILEGDGHGNGPDAGYEPVSGESMTAKILQLRAAQERTLNG